MANPQAFEIGTNLVQIAYWSTQYPFLDFFKSSSRWLTHTDQDWDTEESAKLDLDSRGWIRSLPKPQDVNFTSVGRLIPNPHNGTRFVVLYDGEGTITYRLGAVKDEAASQPGRDVFVATPNQRLNLRITATNPNQNGNYLRNIRVIPEEHVESFQTTLFNPDFINVIQPYKVLRFMDWMQTNDSMPGEWSQRTEVDDSTYFQVGVPVEVMVNLANETQINPWFNMPHLATDEYVENFAQYVKQHLDPSLMVYVELSNEVWNRQFPQARYALEQGRQVSSAADPRDIIADWYSKRTTEIIQIWKRTFADEPARVVGIMAGQAAVPTVLSRALSYAWTTTPQTHAEHGIDAIAIAPYFGGYLGHTTHTEQLMNWTTSPDGGLNQLFQELTQGDIITQDPQGGTLESTYSRISQHRELADAHGLGLVAYEGGQHLVGIGQAVQENTTITNLLIAANRDPRMGALYSEYLAQWNESTNGSLFVHFTDVTVPSRFGSWGALESIYQDSNFKYNTLMKFLSPSRAT